MITVLEIKKVIEDIENGVFVFGFSECILTYTPEDSTDEEIGDEGYYGGHEVYEDTEFINRCSVKVINSKTILNFLKSIISGDGGEVMEDHYQVDLHDYLQEKIEKDLIELLEEDETGEFIVDSIQFYTSDSSKSSEKVKEYKSIGKFIPVNEKIKNLNDFEAIGGDTYSIEVNGVVLFYEESQHLLTIGYYGNHGRYNERFEGAENVEFGVYSKSEYFTDIVPGVECVYGYSERTSGGHFFFAEEKEEAYHLIAFS